MQSPFNHAHTTVVFLTLSIHIPIVLILVSLLQTERNVDPDALKLDTEMEKVFGGSTTQLRDKFDVNQFGDASEEERKFKVAQQKWLVFIY